MGRGTLPEVSDGSGDPQGVRDGSGGPERVGEPSWRSKIGLGTLPKARDG